MANDSRGQCRNRHRASWSSASLRANSASVDARKNRSFSTRRANVSSGSATFTLRSLHAFLQTILHALDLSFLLTNGQMRDTKDDGEHGMVSRPLLHLFPNAPFLLGQLLPDSG